MGGRSRVTIKRWLVVPLAASLVLLPGCGGTAKEQDPKEYLSGTVQIGVNVDLPGWSEYTNGVWLGFDISLANWLGEQVGFRPQFVNVTTDERMTRLEEVSDESTDNDTGIKLVIANFSITDKRRKTIDFAGPYLSDSQGLMTTVDSSITTTEDIQGKAICVTQGSTTEDRLLFGMKIVPTPENTLQRCVERLRAHEVDAVSSDRIILEGFVSREPALLRVVRNIRVGKELYGIGLPNNRPLLCEFLTKQLSTFINEAWDQKLKDNLPGISGQDRKPNSDALDGCQGSTPVAGGPPLAPTPAPLPRHTTLARSRRRNASPKPTLGTRGQPT
jgi:glutamate transport system substrate-binding protein